MNRKLKCVMIDDDHLIIETIKDICHSSPLIDINYSFTEPKRFLEVVDKLNFDLCLLDICMPEMDGFSLMSLLNRKPVIFITAAQERLKEALDLAPIDVVPKPFSLKRLNQAFEKAHKCIVSGKDYENFKTMESEEKIRIRLSDILYVKSDSLDSRRKFIHLKEGRKYTLMNTTFEELLELSPQLVKVNRTELISLEIIHSFGQDVITLLDICKNVIPKQVTLSTYCRESFITAINP